VAELILLGRIVKAVVEQGQQVLIQDLLLPLGERGEPVIEGVELLLGQ
jgi:hypothetical protein